MAVSIPQTLGSSSHHQLSVLATNTFMSVSLFNLKTWRLAAASQVPFEKYLTSNADITSHFSVSL